MRHRKASWDGVERKIHVVNMPHMAAGRTDNMMQKVMVGVGMDGSALVSSLHVAVLDRDGRQVFEGRGGLDLVQEIEVVPVDHSYRIKLNPRGDLFQDRTFVREGIELAFTPYLSPLPAR